MGYLPCEAFILNRQDFSFYDVKNLSGLIYIIDKVVIVMQKFNAKIIEAPRGGAYVEIPFYVEDIYHAKRVKVKALFETIEYRGSLVKMGTDCHILGMPKAIREKLNKQIGDSVSVTIEKDEEERIIELPVEFKEILHQETEALAFWETLSYSNQKKYMTWITSAKKEDTKMKRIESAIQKLINKERYVR